MVVSQRSYRLWGFPRSSRNGPASLIRLTPTKPAIAFAVRIRQDGKQ
jgi:hypothetical protein